MVHELMVKDAVRKYLLYRPSRQEGLPLMIVLHGGLGNAANMRETTGMDGIAETEGFLVAYPEGTGGRLKVMKDKRTWNAGRCCGQAVKQGVDDVLFIERIIEDLSARYAIDRRRVYVTGMSNGAMMAYRLACEIPDKIAAVIAVSGTLSLENCDAAKDVPVLHIHGDSDEHVPYRGGRGEKSIAGVDHRSVPDTVDLLVRSRKCGEPGRTTVNGGVRATSYPCSNGADVSLYVIPGGGHVWPGGSRDDSTGHSLSASRAAWEFARQFAKRPK